MTEDRESTPDTVRKRVRSWLSRDAASLAIRRRIAARKLEQLGLPIIEGGKIRSRPPKPSFPEE